MSETASITRSSSGIAPADISSYRSYLTFEAQSDAVELALQQVAGWLREKGYGEVDLTQSRYARLSDKAELFVAHSLNKRGHSVRVRLAETDARAQQWLTSIAMFSPPRGAGWLSVRVGHTGGKAAETPKIARYLMEVLDLRDSDYRVVAGAPVVRPDDVEDLLDAICDQDRNGLLFVAGTDASGADLFAPFAERIERWARRVHGIAQFVVLDPSATLAFNEGIGETHAVSPWSIRTYVPGVDPAWEPDARRHRILGTRRLAMEPDATISNIIVRAARKHSATQQLPEAARTIIKDLNRAEDRVLLDSLFAETSVDPAAPSTPSTTTSETPVNVDHAKKEAATGADAPLDHTVPPAAADHDPQSASAPVDRPVDQPDTAPRADEPGSPSTESDVAAAAAEYLATIDMVKQALGVEDLTAEVLQQIAEAASRSTAQANAREAIADRVSRELAERQGQIEALEDQLSEARVVADDAIIEQRISDDARRSAEDEARWLRRVLNERGRHDEAWSPLPDTEVTSVPDDFEDLLDRLDGLEADGIIFTGDRRLTLGLDDQDTMGNIVAAAWECLLVLRDYVAAKKAGDYEGNVKTYLKHTPAGYRTVPKSRFGESETKSTLNQWGDERVFVVPTEVHETQQVLMEAHFKLPHCGMVTPRIHYYDHTHASGNVYIGYIGPHLRTKATN